VLAETGSSVGEPHLDASLGQGRGLGQLLPRVNVRILGAGEGSLQGLQLFGGEGGAGATLLAFQRNPRLRLRITYVGVAA